MTPPIERALLFTDLVDSTHWTERLGDERARVLWTAHDRAARDLLALHDGREIDRSDGFFLLFDAAEAAAAYAVGYQGALATLGLQARAGLHVGLVMLRTNDAADVARGARPLEVDGLAKPFAARLMALAPPGRTLASAAAQAALAGRGESCGHYRLKGLEQPVEVFELGGPRAAAPPPDSEKAYRVVRDGELWRPLREVRHNLPADRDAFVGRAGELADLALRLAGGERLVTIVGPGGTGKTRLARRYGRAWLGEWPGGVYFCDLAEARSRDGVCFAVAAALGVALGKDDAAEQLGHAIAGRGRCLAILDNFEQVVAHADATVGAWLERAGKAAFVVTSRERLRVAGETVYPVGPLPLDGDALELFACRARAQRPDFALGSANRAAVAEVVRLLDGLPLAIELAAARVRVLSPAQLVERMRERFVLLAGARGPAARQATLRAAIDWSWNLLAPWEQAALAQCAVFEGGFSLADAEAVVDLGAWPEAGPVLDTVQALVDKSLLRTWVPQAATRHDFDEPYFGMYLSIREYAAERLAAAGADTLGHAQERHGRCFARLGEDEAIAALDRHGGTARVAALALEADNLAVALRRAAARGDGAVAVGCFRALWELLFRRGPFAPGVELGRLALATPGAPAAAEAHARIGLALAHRRLGHPEEPPRLLDEALALAREAGDRRTEAEVLRNISLMAHHAGEVERALALAEQALATFVAIGERQLEGVMHANLGNLLCDLGRADDAVEHYGRALDAHREVGNRRAEGIALGNLGTVHFDFGRLAEARTTLEAALAIDRETGSMLSQGIALGNLGNLHEHEGRLDEALASNEAALAIFRELGSRRDEGIALGQIARIRHAQRRDDEARALYDAALAIHRAVGNRRHEAGTLNNVGEMLLDLGDAPGAMRALAAAEALLRTLGDAMSLGVALAVRGLAGHSLGDAAAARAALAEAQAIAAELGALPDSELQLAIGRLRDALGRDNPAP